jgi:hypothetical protein
VALAGQGQGTNRDAGRQTAATTARNLTIPAGAQLLRESLSFHHNLKSFTCSLDVGFVVDQDGLSVKADKHYSVALQQPRSLAVIVKNSPKGKGSTFVCDGSQQYTYLVAANKYSLSPAPKSVAEIDFDKLDQLEKMPSPYEYLQPLIGRSIGEVFSQGFDTATLGAEETVDGVACAHAQFDYKVGHFDVWIEKGKQPLLRKIACEVSKIALQSDETLRGANIRFYVQYQDWRVNPVIPAEQFQFAPPPGAQIAELLYTAPKEKEGGDLLGKPAPVFKMDLLNGGQFDLAAERGKHIVVLQFWATWSVPSTRNLPEVARIASSFANKDVVFCAINQGQDPQVVRKFLAQLKTVPSVAIEKSGADTSNLYKVSSAPYFVVIDKKGIVRFCSSDYQVPVSIEQRLQELVSEKAQVAANGPG